MKPREPAPLPEISRWQRYFSGLFGAFLGLTLLKLGNPPIFEHLVTPPGSVFDALLVFPWPMAWGWWLLGCLGLLAYTSASWRWPAVRWPIAMLLAWLAWQFVSALGSVEPGLTAPVLFHFTGCAACFFIGCFSLGRRPLGALLTCLFIAFLIVLGVGFQQHFGGLQQTREYFLAYLYPQTGELPPGYLQKLSSSRIFGTLFYPNALAGCILLLAPVLLTALAGAGRYFTKGARAFLVGGTAAAALACLAWSGSKGGWLIMLLLGFLALLRSNLSRALRIWLVIGVVIVGLSGFAVRYAAFFRRGATSVVARFDYWQAALQTAKEHPLLGTGPGTFSKPYQRIKRPEAEMARLAHNDYLEQASDSGWPGFLAYGLFITGSIYHASKAWFRRHGPAPATKGGNGAERRWLEFSIWLGVLGWALQSCVEFGLYIPALAWPAFTFLGWLLSSVEPSVVRRPEKP